MKNQLSPPAVIGGIAVVVVIVALIGYRIFGPQGAPPVQTTPIRTLVTPPVGGKSEPAPGIKVNVQPP